MGRGSQVAPVAAVPRVKLKPKNCFPIRRDRRRRWKKGGLGKGKVDGQQHHLPGLFMVRGGQAEREKPNKKSHKA